MGPKAKGKAKAKGVPASGSHTGGSSDGRQGLPLSIANVNANYWPIVQGWIDDIKKNEILASLFTTDVMPYDLNNGGRIAPFDEA
eukprot:5209073-Lingulodinium_polyedra.AAC.1